MQGSIGTPFGRAEPITPAYDLDVGKLRRGAADFLCTLGNPLDFVVIVDPVPATSLRLDSRSPPFSESATLLLVKSTAPQHG